MVNFHELWAQCKNKQKKINKRTACQFVWGWRKRRFLERKISCCSKRSIRRKNFFLSSFFLSHDSDESTDEPWIKTADPYVCLLCIPAPAFAVVTNAFIYCHFYFIPFFIYCRCSCCIFHATGFQCVSLESSSNNFLLIFNIHNHRIQN